MSGTGAYCEVYGNTINNRILEYLLENQDLEIAVGDVAKELEISRPKAYEVIKQFEKKGYVKKTRIIGKTQLYRLNKTNNRVKLFLKNFNECLKLVIEEYQEKSEEDHEVMVAQVYLGNIHVNEKLVEA